jgi:two-component system cell cycle sensor histidine kinase/response regulator CckA
LGIAGSIAFLILVSPFFIWSQSRIRDPKQFDYESILSNFIEVLGYTSIIHFAGGLQAAYLAMIYAIFIAYLGLTAPRRFPFFMAAFSSGCFSLMVIAEKAGILHHLEPIFYAPGTFQITWPDLFMILIVICGLLFVMAWVSASTAALLRANRKKLRLHNLELEERVAARTAELEQANRNLQAEVARRTLTQEALRFSEEKYRTILERMQEGYFELDLDFRFTFLNQAAADVFDRPVEDLLGIDFHEIIEETSAMEAERAFRQIFETGQPVESVSFELRLPGGAHHFIEASASLLHNEEGEVVGFFGVGRDVTSHKTLEARLTQTRDFLTSIFDSSLELIGTTDLNGKIVFTSSRIREMLGYTPAEIEGRRVVEIYAQGKNDARTIAHALDESGGLRNHEMQLIHKDGRLVDVKLTASYLYDVQGNEVGTLGIFRDVTEEKRLEAQLRFAQRIEAIGTLAGGLAHDFNNLLMGIQGNASLILLNIKSTHPHYQGLKNIEKLVQSGAKLTSQLLGYARKGRYELKPLNLGQVIRETADTFGRAKREVIVHLDIQDDIAAVEADQGQLEQVLFNLYVNAADAMPEGGDLYIAARNVTHKDIKAALYEAKPGLYVMVEVTDTGTGMDEETMKRIFDPFFTTKEMGRGTGLGLASSYGIVKAHAGYIDVESASGRGSTFKVSLPASEKAANTAEDHRVNIVKGSGTVLLVDDEDMVREVASELLGELGYRVMEAGNGEQALRIYQDLQQDIDVVILDMIMPGMGGGQVFDRLREINADVRVLLSSGYSMDGQAMGILGRGCDGFIQKPFNLEQLSQKIEEITAQAPSPNSPADTK